MLVFIAFSENIQTLYVSDIIILIINDEMCLWSHETARGLLCLHGASNEGDHRLAKASPKCGQQVFH